MKKMLLALLMVVILNLVVGCEVTQEVQPGTLVTITSQDVSQFAHWVDHNTGDHDDDD